MHALIFSDEALETAFRQRFADQKVNRSTSTASSATWPRPTCGRPSPSYSVESREDVVVEESRHSGTLTDMKWSMPSRANDTVEAKKKSATSNLVRELTDAELADALTAYRGGTYCVRYMNPGKGSATIHPVMGVMDFQNVLALVAATPRPSRHPYDKHVPAVLRLDVARGVAVRIDGYLVGYLTPDTATATRPLVEQLAGTGQSLVCAALIVGGGDKSYGIRLQIRPGAATRWAAGTKPAELA